MSKTQAKGSAFRVLIDREATANTSPDFADRLPLILPINTIDFQAQRTLQHAETLRGDRNSVAPFQGNLDVSGNIVLPIDDQNIGHIMRGLFGAPYTTKDQPTSADVMVGSPTLTISSGVGTFSVAQTGAALHDRVIYADATTGTIYTAYLTGDAGDGLTTTWDMDTTNDAGGSAPDDITAAVVLYIVTNSANATPGTVTFASNVATFSQTQASMAAGALLIYNGTSRAKIVSVTDTTHAVVEGILGADVSDGGPHDVEAIELGPLFYHKWIVDPTESMPTIEVEKGFTDLEVPYFELYKGCKVGGIEVGFGGDGELTASVPFMGAQQEASHQPYDKADHMTATAPTITIATLAYTLSSAQTSSAQGDFIAYIDDNGEEQLVEIGTRTNDTTGAVVSSPGDVTGGQVLAIYPGADSDSIAQERFGERFMQFDASSKVNGTTVRLFKEWSINLSNNLDGDQFLIGGEGVREEIPEGLFSATGNLSAIFSKMLLVDLANDFETCSLEIRLDRGSTGRYLRFYFPEVKLQQRSPQVSGPAGIMYDPTFEAFKDTGESTVVVELVGPEMSYA